MKKSNSLEQLGKSGETAGIHFSGQIVIIQSSLPFCRRKKSTVNDGNKVLRFATSYVGESANVSKKVRLSYETQKLTYPPPLSGRKLRRIIQKCTAILKENLVHKANLKLCWRFIFQQDCLLCSHLVDINPKYLTVNRVKSYTFL